MVARRLQVLGEGRLRAVEAVEHRHAVLVAVLAREDAGPAGRADRVDAEAGIQAHALLGDAVEVRRLVDPAAIGADGVRRMVVGHDVENVGPRRDIGSVQCGQRRKQQGSKSTGNYGQVPHVWFSLITCAANRDRSGFLAGTGSLLGLLLVAEDRVRLLPTGDYTPSRSTRRRNVCARKSRHGCELSNATFPGSRPSMRATLRHIVGGLPQTAYRPGRLRHSG